MVPGQPQLPEVHQIKAWQHLLSTTAPLAVGRAEPIPCSCHKGCASSPPSGICAYVLVPWPCTGCGIGNFTWFCPPGLISACLVHWISLMGKRGSIWEPAPGKGARTCRPKLGGEVGWKSRATWCCRQPVGRSAQPVSLFWLCPQSVCNNCTSG